MNHQQTEQITTNQKSNLESRSLSRLSTGEVTQMLDELSLIEQFSQPSKRLPPGQKQHHSPGSDPLKLTISRRTR